MHLASSEGAAAPTLASSLNTLSLDSLRELLLSCALENEQVAASIQDKLRQSQAKEISSSSGSTDSEFVACSPDRRSSMTSFDFRDSRPLLRSGSIGSVSSSSSRSSVELLPFLPSWNWSYYYYKESQASPSSKRIVVDEEAAEEGKAKAFYWNEEFQHISERIRDVDLFDEEHIYVAMANLYHDFEYAAETYGKIIIAERFLPVSQKSIPPAFFMGGQAGGEKYIVQGILFKFAVDKNGLYNGDHYAAKAAGHDLKSLIQVYKSRVPGIFVPMMCLVDYLGYRLIAMSMLPVDTTTLCYGSCDGGMDVHDDIPEFNSKMMDLGKALNLKVHAAGSGGKEIVGPCDIEGHNGKDDRFYLLDFARLFPPEAPIILSKRKNEHLYRLLRPELVRKFNVPLSSDAYTLFGKRGAGVHNREVRMATEHLLYTLIPRFAGILDFQESTEDWPKHKNHYKIKITEEKLPEILHREGINVRHLGRVRTKVTSEKWRNALLIEILTRVIKNTIREKLRSQMEQLKHPGLVPYRQAILEYLNLVFGQSPSSTIYWCTELLEKIELLYEDTLFIEKQQDTIHELKGSVDLLALFTALRRLTGLVFSPHCISEAKLLFHSPNPFQDTDLLGFPPKVKEMRIAAYASATALYLKAKYNTGKTESERLASISSVQFEAALRSSPDDDMILCNYALLLRLQKRYDEASTYFKMAIQSNPRNTRIMCHYAWFLYQDLQQHKKAEKYYHKILSIDPHHSRTLSDYATFLWLVREDVSRAEDYFQKGIEMGDKQAFAGYASFLSRAGRASEARYYEEHLKSANGVLIMHGKYS